MNKLDGFQVYAFFHAGSQRINASREYIDRINVFPVPDGDTGTNLSATLSQALAATVPVNSASITLGNLAAHAQQRAYGNSGVIFSQFVSGLSEAVQSAEMYTQEFVSGVRRAYQRAKSAVSTPRDGTILSVIEDWASSLARYNHTFQNFAELIGATRPDLRASLAGTTERLQELKDAGVVDAGAAGFIEFVEGGHDFLLSGHYDEAIYTHEAHLAIPFSGEHDAGRFTKPSYRYCTEAVIEATSLDAEDIRAVLKDAGDCLIVGVGKKHTKVHVHTDTPSKVMSDLGEFGPVVAQKADDMLIQFADAHDRRAKTAIVTDSSCDLPADLILKHRIHAVPILISTGKSEYLDKITMDAAALRKLADQKGIFPRTSQPPNPFFSRLFSNLSSFYDDVLAIHLAGTMSGTLAASQREAEKSEGKVVSVDSRHLSGSLGLLVLRAAEAAEEGMNRAEILSNLDEWSSKARIFVSVSSLRYMVKGGRVSPLKGKLASVLNLKPIVSVDETGKSILYGKAFSEAANLRKIVAMAVQQHAKLPLRCYAIGHSGALENAKKVAAMMEKEIGFPPLYIDEISAVVALNAGPGPYRSSP
ncbi:DegV family protein [Treponema sp.]